VHTYVPQYERPLSILVASSTLSVGHGMTPGTTNEALPVGLPMLRSLNGALSMHDSFTAKCRNARRNADKGGLLSSIGKSHRHLGSEDLRFGISKPAATDSCSMLNPAYIFL